MRDAAIAAMVKAIAEAAFAVVLNAVVEAVSAAAVEAARAGVLDAVCNALDASCWSLVRLQPGIPKGPNCREGSIGRQELLQRTCRKGSTNFREGL